MKEEICLLLHGLVDRYTVLDAHLVKFVNANDAAVGQYHGAALEKQATETSLMKTIAQPNTNLEVELARARIANDRSGETGRR